MNTFTYEHLEKNGRLGNQLWQIAGTVSEAKADGGYARFDPAWTYRQFFTIPDYLFSEIPAGSVQRDMGTNYCQHLDYVNNVESDVREWFKPTELAWDMLNEYLEARAPEFWLDEERTAVHVRRGDYLKNPHLFPAPSVSYYRDNAARWPGAEVYVFSDDIPWCKENFPNTWNFIEGIETPVEVEDRPDMPYDQFDLFAMTYCQHHVISNSTFSWWGAFLSENKEVVYPKPWFGPKIAEAGDNDKCPAPPTWIEQTYAD